MTPIAFSPGMGLHSSTALEELRVRSEFFDTTLPDVTVFIARTGGESKNTRRQMEQLVFPRLRASRRRVIQVARAGPSVRKHGIATLDDTREPHVCHTTGAFYALYTELIVAGAVPTYGDGVRKCSVHAKGNVLDASMLQVYGEMPIRHMIGFHTGERKRIERDHGYSGAAHQFEYPLVHHAAATLRSPRRGSAPP